jgi:hypothetical protein
MIRYIDPKTGNYISEEEYLKSKPAPRFETIKEMIMNYKGRAPGMYKIKKQAMTRGFESLTEKQLRMIKNFINDRRLSSAIARNLDLTESK